MADNVSASSVNNITEEELTNAAEGLTGNVQGQLDDLSNRMNTPPEINQVNGVRVVSANVDANGSRPKLMLMWDITTWWNLETGNISDGAKGFTGHIYAARNFGYSNSVVCELIARVNYNKVSEPDGANLVLKTSNDMFRPVIVHRTTDDTYHLAVIVTGHDKIVRFCGLFANFGAWEGQRINYNGNALPTGYEMACDKWSYIMPQYTLPISNGGTGEKTANAALNVLTEAAQTENDSYAFSDDDSLLWKYTSAASDKTKTFKTKFSKLWNYIRTKILDDKIFVGYRGDIPMADLDTFVSRKPGTYKVTVSNGSYILIVLSMQSGGASALEIFSKWDMTEVKVRTVIDNNRYSQWVPLAFKDASVQKAGGTMTGELHLEKNFANSGGGVFVKDTVKGTEVWMGVGSGQLNHGLFSATLNKWMVYANETGVTLNGNALTATKATQDSDGKVIKDTYAKKTDVTKISFSASEPTTVGANEIVMVYEE